jgi:hypothetical protein
MEGAGCLCKHNVFYDGDVDIVALGVVGWLDQWTMWLVEVDVEVVRCDPTHQSRLGPGLEVTLHNTSSHAFRPTTMARQMYMYVRAHGPIPNDSKSVSSATARPMCRICRICIRFWMPALSNRLSLPIEKAPYRSKAVLYRPHRFSEHAHERSSILIQTSRSNLGRTPDSSYCGLRASKQH